MRRILPLVVCLLAACGGGGGGSTPNSPTPPATTPPANQNPVINNISVNPTFGIATFTSYTFSSSASDANNDTLTYTWDLAGNARTGASQTIVFSNGGSGAATLTVTDGRGGSATQTVNFISGTGNGNWSASIPFTAGARPMSLSLTQSSTSGAMTGTWSVPSLATIGNLDPAAQNGIDASGRVVLRFKITQGGTFNDFTFTGQMQTTGTSIVGSVSGSGFAGQAMTLTK
jgi:hypothetical protein